MSGRLIHSILILFCFFTQAAHAQPPGKEQNIRLDSVTVSAVRRSLRVRQREDAVLVDSTTLSIDEVVDPIIAIV